MAQRQEQNIKALQKFVLSTQMKHSVQLLGMAVQDLNDYIDTVVSTNPLIEKDKEQKTFKVDTYRRKNTALYTPEDNTDIEQNVSPQETLLFQIRALGLDEKALEIAEYLVYEINCDGYIKITSEEAAGDLCVDEDAVEDIVSLIQKLDPPGIGARDIRECLQLQLERQGKKDSLEYRIVTEFLSDLAINDIIAIARALKIDKAHVLKAAGNIKNLTPRPGSSIMAERSRQVVPDLIATVKNNKIRLEINRAYTPKLRLYNPYGNEMDIIKDPEARAFLKKNTKAATQLFDNIKRREETMCRVAYYMLQYQQDHIEENKSHVKTLTIQDLSKALELHMSTISRTVSNKYIEINGKVVPLRSLLSHGVNNKNGEHTSKTYIKNVMVKIIEAEDKTHPLSDLRIATGLLNKGINIKRRTVAKYRESLKILPTHLRKRVKV